MHLSFPQSVKMRAGALLAVCGLVAATELAVTGMASASPSPTGVPVPAGISVTNTLIPAGSSGPVDITTPDDSTIGISIDPRGADFGNTADEVTWDGSACHINGGEFLECTPTNHAIRIYLHIPSSATVGGTVIVEAGQWDTGGKGVVTVYYPAS